MKASRMPISAWNLIGDQSQVATADGQRHAGQHHHLAGELQRMR
jgi:hypothetical protein